MITLNGDTGITTPGLINTGSTTLINLTTTGNTILGDQSTDTLNVANGNLVLNSSGNLGVGTASPARKLQVNSGEAVAVRFTRGGGIVANNSLEWFDGTNGWYAGVSGSNFWGVAYNSSGAIDSAAIRLDSSGNLGLGVTPSAWATFTGLQVGALGGVNIGGASGDTFYAMNAYYNAGWKYAATGTTALMYRLHNGEHKWSNAPSGTAGNAITFTQAMTLDASGNLGIGATSMGTTRLVIRGDATTNFAVAKWSHSSNASSGFDIGYASSVTSNDVSLWNYENGFMRFATNGTERARIDSSGNLLVGGTSVLQSAKITSYGSVSAQNGGVDGTFANAFVGVYSANSNEHNAIQTAVSSGGTLSGFRFKASLGGGSATTYPVLDLTRDQTIFYTANAERARIDSNGRMIVNGTAAIYSATFTLYKSGNSYNLGSTTTGTGNEGHVVFENGNGAVGTIFTNGSSTAYNTSSDYRLKNTIAPMTGALTRVAQLRPVTYKWNSDGSDGEGFIAHELAEVVPQCVTGEKDGVDEEGKPQYQGIDVSFLVATLTAAIQELKAELDSVKSELATIKGAA
jgi:hypothetical protein